ncbi:MAG: NAD(P)H-binding protein [Myxococcales bacterium]|nr:NAD(P)H-binding protein [Myxococcales bacterium]
MGERDVQGTAFVAGATGYSGRALVPELLRAGFQTIAHIRPDSPRRREDQVTFEGLGARVDTTPWDGAAMERTLTETRPSHVFSLLGTTRSRTRRALREGRDESYEAVDYGLSVLLIRAAVASGTSPHFVYLSSVGVREGTSSAYLAARHRVESELRASGLPFTIVRPSFIAGDREERRVAERLASTIADGVLSGVALLGGRTLRDRYASMTGSTLARYLVRAVRDPKSRGAVLEGGDLRAYGGPLD